MHSFIAFFSLLFESRHLPPLRRPLFSTRCLARHNFFPLRRLFFSAQHEDKRVENYLFQVREEEEKKVDKKKDCHVKMLEEAERKFVTRKVEGSSFRLLSHFSLFTLLPLLLSPAQSIVQVEREKKNITDFYINVGMIRSLSLSLSNDELSRTQGDEEGERQCSLEVEKNN